MARGEGGAGWSGKILERGQRNLDGFEVWKRGSPDWKSIAELCPPYSSLWAWSAKGGKSSSVNHKAGAWGNELARAALCGPVESFEFARGVALDTYFPRELDNVGLGASEVLVPDSHTHQHLHGVVMMRIGAFVSGDSLLLDRSAALLRRWSILLKAVASPDPYFYAHSAGYRSAHGAPVWWSGTAFLRQLMLRPGPMPAFTNKHKRTDPWKDLSNAPIRGLRLLREKGDDLSFAVDATSDDLSTVLLNAKLSVWRSPDGHVAAISRPDNPPLEDVCDWVKVAYHPDFDKMREGAEFGMNWTTPVPEPFPGSRLISTKGE